MSKYIRLADRPELIKAARAMCESGVSRADISLQLGVRYEVVRSMTFGLKSSRGGKRFVSKDGDRPLPEPTLAQPKTREKIAVFRQRLLSGEQLYHPDDAPVTLDPYLDPDEEMDFDPTLQKQADEWCLRLRNASKQ